ncbi:MAG: sterol desaturase family protein [Cyclobacteriaceae bacterium]|nr:sterol desaturase family protein [Cyclobacteriaceae bacterium]
MESVLIFFENLPSWFRGSLLVGGIVLFWMLEGLIPLYTVKYKKWSHAGINLTLTVINAAIGIGLAFTLLKTTEFSKEYTLGFLHWIEIPLILEVIIGLMMLDLFGAYLVHWTEHKIKWMWKFHIIHHTDTNIDVTSGLRHHPGEIIFRTAFTLFAVLITGAPMSVVVLYQSLSVLFTHLTHANINMPDKTDRFLSLLFVSPNMHKIHHHYKLPLTDTNYGNIFSIWDRLFGTFVYAQKGSIVYGIDTHMEPREHSNMKNLFKIPFSEYRPPTSTDSKFK